MIPVGVRESKFKSEVMISQNASAKEIGTRYLMIYYYLQGYWVPHFGRLQQKIEEKLENQVIYNFRGWLLF